MSSLTRLVCIVFLMTGLSGCLGTIIDTAVDTTIAVVKVPIKVAGAAIDVVSGSDDKKSDEKESVDDDSK